MSERPLVYVGVTGGIAEVEIVGDVDVVHIDYDILNSDAPSAEELRQWIAAIAAQQSLTARLPQPCQAAIRKAVDRAHAVLAALETHM